jgi:predicted RNA binding protein YcfA (HicA-like mRNA interferase family)
MKPQKTLEKILPGSQNIAFGDMVSLVEAFGFSLDRITGSHHIFGREGILEGINLQPHRGKAKPYQVRQFMKLVEKYDLKLGEGA